MPRRVTGITPGILADLPVSCRACGYWELSPSVRRRSQDCGSEAVDKLAWVSDTIDEWGSCGLIVYVDEIAAGYLSYAPPAYVPRADSFATSPPASDSLLLMTGRIADGFAGQGLGRVLVQTAAREAAKRGLHALEAFGRAGTDGVVAADGGERCLLPVDYLTAVGFTTVRPHPRTPRLRLDVRTAIGWRSDVESALERLFGTLPSAVLSP